jgi:DNA-binding CsgD family transcriptional regulator
MEQQFDLWKLTNAEKVIAVLSLQGHELEKIAAIRGAAVGTVRAQLAKIYGKSGVSNRAQLSAVFVERLIAGEDPPPPPQGS